jgi:hypothetical protein
MTRGSFVTAVKRVWPRAYRQRRPTTLAAARHPGRLTALGVFVLLACLHTWPMITNPAHLSRTDNGDALLNMWAISWVAHQLPRDPRHLFDANIFYPEPLTLAYSEAMIVQGVLAMPVIAAGGSPVLAFNLVLLAGFALTGWAFCLLLHRWTGTWAAGYTAGSLAAFNAFIFLRLPHLQTFHVEFVALLLFALDRLIVSRRGRDAVLLGTGFALQGLTSVYLLVFTTWMLCFAVTARAGEWLRRRAFQAIGLFVLAGLVAAILLGPYVYAYERLHRLTGFGRSVAEAQRGAASWRTYLSTVSRFHFNLWSHSFLDPGAPPAFPGVAAIALSLLAVAREETRRDPRVRMCAVAGLGCAALSMLPRAPFFPAIYPLIPGIAAIRVVGNLAQLVLLLFAVVAGFGVSALHARFGARRYWRVVAVALVAFVALEARHAPLRLRFFGEIPAIYDTLADQHGAVVIELPFHPPDVAFANAEYMLNSTRHWRPMLNGYSGYRPASYAVTFKAIQGFPDQAALTALHERGVTHVFVHADAFRGAFGNNRFDSLRSNPALMHVAESGDIVLWKLR